MYVLPFEQLFISATSEHLKKQFICVKNPVCQFILHGHDTTFMAFIHMYWHYYKMHVSLSVSTSLHVLNNEKYSHYRVALQHLIVLKGTTMLNDKFPCSNPFFPLLLKSVEHNFLLCVFRCLDNCLFFFVLPSFMSYFPNSLWHCLPTKFFFSPMWEKWYMNIFYPRVWCNPMLVLFSENLSKNKLLHIYIYVGWNSVDGKRCRPGHFPLLILLSD